MEWNTQTVGVLATLVTALVSGAVWWTGSRLGRDTYLASASRSLFDMQRTLVADYEAQAKYWRERYEDCIDHRDRESEEAVDG
jgi:hypothetical protein